MELQELQVCRVCLNKTANLCIFDKQDELQYSVKIMKCVNIVIAEGDGMPDFICKACAGDLFVSYEFITRCEASDTALRSVPYNVTHNYEMDIKDEDIKSDLSDDPTYSNFHSSNLSYNNDKPTKKLKRRRITKSGPVSCKICGYETLSYSVLKKHMQVHNKDLHKSTLSWRGRLNQHLESIHSEILGKDDIIKTNFKKIKPKSGPIQCVQCGLMVRSKSAMEAHNRTHTGEKPFSCDVCKVQFKVKGSLKKHIETHHLERKRKFTCETCGCSFYRKCEIVVHMRIHTNERPYACTVCPKAFRQISSLIRHKYYHTGERKHSCPICSKMFYDKAAIRKHLSVHSNMKEFSCHLCNKSVKSKCSLATHMKVHTNKKDHICTFCGMEFSLKGNLQTHIRRKHSEKSGQCELCMKTFPDLEQHMRKHTGEKPFACKLCSQAFGTKRSLSYHIVFKHKNAEKFKCDIEDCTKSYPTCKLLEVHLLKDHTNHTPFLCPHCSRGFFRSSDLTRHLKGSHMDKSKVQYKIEIQEIK